jgi:hypothetical protein
MTDEEAKELYEGLVKEFGDKLPNPEHQPLSFAYYVKIYRFLTEPVKV